MFGLSYVIFKIYYELALNFTKFKTYSYHCSIYFWIMD